MTSLKTHQKGIPQLMGGKKIPDRYDWAKDPKGLCEEKGHIPPNRCYLCGFRFVGSRYAAFCNICDNAMSMGDQDDAIPISGRKESKLISRREMVATRIRIPEDITDETSYAEKMKIPEVKVSGIFKAADLL